MQCWLVQYDIIVLEVLALKEQLKAQSKDQSNRRSRLLFSMFSTYCYNYSFIRSENFTEECFVLHLCTENNYTVLLERWVTIHRYDFSFLLIVLVLVLIPFLVILLFVWTLTLILWGKSSQALWQKSKQFWASVALVIWFIILILLSLPVLNSTHFFSWKYKATSIRMACVVSPECLW